jgi:hypothetical protein
MDLQRQSGLPSSRKLGTAGVSAGRLGPWVQADRTDVALAFLGVTVSVRVAGIGHRASRVADYTLRAVGEYLMPALRHQLRVGCAAVSAGLATASQPSPYRRYLIEGRSLAPGRYCARSGSPAICESAGRKEPTGETGSNDYLALRSAPGCRRSVRNSLHPPRGSGTVYEDLASLGYEAAFTVSA